MKPGSRTNAVRIVEQLSVFVANKPGTLARLCDALSDAEINIYALTISDTVDHAVVRMVVSNPGLARTIFESYGTLVVENDVLMIENDNKPGSLSTIAMLLADKRVNIEYAYLASMPTAKRGLLILRTNNTRKAHRILSDHWL